MDQPRDQAPAAPESTESQSPQLVSRRRLLKILAAGGGAVVASALLPDAWSVPAVQALPLDPVQLTGLHVTSSRMASFTYYDPLAEVDDDYTYLWTSIDRRSDGERLLRDREAEGLLRYGNAQNGTIRFPLWWTGNMSTHQVCVIMRVSAINSATRYSNDVCARYWDDQFSTPSSSSAHADRARADVSAIIYGGWNGILVKASVGGEPQPTLATALDAWGRPAVLWTLYPAEDTSWTVVVTPQLPAGLDPERWQFQPASASATIAYGSGVQVIFQLVDTGA